MEAQDVDQIDLSSIYIIHLELYKKVNDQSLTSMRFKAPANMTLGKLFYWILLIIMKDRQGHL